MSRIMKATAIAPSNIAFIKYWGKRNESLTLPENGSISMNLSDLLTTTTVEFNENFKNDSIEINGIKGKNEDNRAIQHLDRIRKIAKINLKAKVVSKNNFPLATGLSSSASGFAALTLAAVSAADLKLSEKELSILARQGSGSSCRSIPDGFVEWLDGTTSETSYAVSLYPPNYWDIADIVVIVGKDKKAVSTTEGQKLAKSSPFFKVRLENINKKINLIKKYLKEKDFKNFGELIEQEALELHAVMLTSTPSLIYWLPGTLRVIHAVRKWRKGGLQVYFTLNTGQNVHLICQKKSVKEIVKRVEKMEEVSRTIVNFSTQGAHLISVHLF